MLKVANSVIDASRITGTLPVANGGTGVTTSTGTGNTVLSASPTLSGILTVGAATGQNGVFDAVVGNADATTGDNTGLVIVSNPTGQGWLGFNNGNSAGIPGQVTYNHNTALMAFYSSGTYQFSNGNVTLSTGNLIIGTSGKGIDFSITSHPAGMTSELLSDYEEGTWTPTDQSGAALTFTSVTGLYTKIGRLVTCTFGLTFPATVSGASVSLGGLPFTAIGSGTPNPSGGSVTYTGAAVSAAGFAVGTGGTTVELYGASGTALTNANFSTFILRAQFTYTAA